MNLNRSDILALADQLINGARAQDYGDARKNFTRMAVGFDVIAKEAIRTHGRITSKHAALIMDWLKTCRLLETIDHDDSWIDKCGYSALGGEIDLTDRSPDEPHSE